MRLVVSLFIACMLVAACSPDDFDGDDFAESIFGAASDLPPGARASGALVRVVNLYNPLHGEPGPLDLHPRPWASEGNQPLGSVTYGTVSELFDPLVHNDQGHMYVSMYQEGTTGNGNEIMTATATLTGGEVITYLVASSYNTHSSGRRNGAMRTYHHRDRNMRPITAGRGLVQLETFGLDEVIDRTSVVLYLSTGSGCLPAVGDTQRSYTRLRPGSTVGYELPPGRHTATIHTAEACAGPTFTSPVPITVEEGGRSLLILYAPRDGDFRSLFVPLTPTEA
jgi:hypothetical protein